MLCLRYKTSNIVSISISAIVSNGKVKQNWTKPSVCNLNGKQFHKYSPPPLVLLWVCCCRTIPLSPPPPRWPLTFPWLIDRFFFSVKFDSLFIVILIFLSIGWLHQATPSGKRKTSRLVPRPGPHIYPSHTLSNRTCVIGCGKLWLFSCDFNWKEVSFHFPPTSTCSIASPKIESNGKYSRASIAYKR